MKALVELAASVMDGDKTENMSELVRSAMEQVRAENETAAANDIVALVRQIDAHKVSKRVEIRKLKAQLNKIVADLDDLDRRWEYGQHSNNFLPVMRLFGMVAPFDLVDPSTFDTATSVPAGFVAPKTKKGGK